MDEVTIIGVDLAKSVFQLHGAGPDGRVVFRKKLSRPQFRLFLERQAPCLVAMEACATSHYWGREIAAMGHEVRLIPPAYVKPFVRRHKNDAADAEAIAEAALRPSMRAVAVKSADQQSLAMLLKTREMLVRQRNQLINALRGHLMEYGITAPAGRHMLHGLAGRIEDPDAGLPALVIKLSRLHFDQIRTCDEKVAALDKSLRDLARSDPEAVRLQTAPGIGLLNAMAIRAFAPEMGSFRRGRDLGSDAGGGRILRQARFGHLYSPVSRISAHPRGEMWARRLGETSTPSRRRLATASSSRSCSRWTWAWRPSRRLRKGTRSLALMTNVSTMFLRETSVLFVSFKPSCTEMRHWDTGSLRPSVARTARKFLKARGF